LIAGDIFQRVLAFASAVFGLALCSQFDVVARAAPILVERCTRALEERAFADTTLDLYKIYHSSPPNEQTLELRQKLNEGETERRSLARSFAERPPTGQPAGRPAGSRDRARYK